MRMVMVIVMKRMRMGREMERGMKGTVTQMAM